MAQVAAMLPPPQLASSGSAGFGALAALAASETVLWQASPGLAVDSIRVRPANLPTTASLGLQWISHGSASVLQAKRRDALGGTDTIALAECRWDADAGALVWAWLPAEVDRTLAVALEALGTEAAISVWELQRSDGQQLAEVQGLVPAEISTRIGHRPARLSNPSGINSVAADRLHLKVTDPPAGWMDERTASGGVWLQHRDAPVTLQLELNTSRRDGLELAARWHEAPEDLQRQRIALASAIDADRAWLDRWTQARQDHAQSLGSLPKNSDGTIDESRRSDPAWREAFDRLDEQADAIGRIRDERDVHPEELRPALTQRESQRAELQQKLTAMSAFPGVAIEVNLTSSGATLAHVEITP
ncbi:MAG: hypothetical protein AAF328_12110 [Planctomycetota bacterium]